jgi:hypothetical protein
MGNSAASDAVQSDLEAIFAIFKRAVLDRYARSIRLGMDEGFADVGDGHLAVVGKGSHGFLIHSNGNFCGHGWVEGYPSQIIGFAREGQ